VRDPRVGIPAAEAVLAWVEVLVAEPAAVIRVRAAAVRELLAAALAVASVTAPAAVQVLVLLRAAAPQAGPVVVQAFPVDQEVVQAGPALDSAVVQATALARGTVVTQAFPADREVVLVVPGLDLAGVQAVALGLGPVAAQAFPVHREVVRVAALQEVRPEHRAERVVQRAAGLALQVMQAVARATVEADAARVAGPVAADPVVVRVARQAGVAPRLDQPAVSGPARLANVVRSPQPARHRGSNPRANIHKTPQRWNPQPPPPAAQTREKNRAGLALLTDLLQGPSTRWDSGSQCCSSH